MTDIVVYRGSADKEGEEIFDVLLSEVAPALRRGAFEIDVSAPQEVVTFEADYDPEIRPGKIVEVVRLATGATEKGLVMSVSHAVEGPVVITQFKMVRGA